MNDIGNYRIRRIVLLLLSFVLFFPCCFLLLAAAAACCFCYPKLLCGSANDWQKQLQQKQHWRAGSRICAAFCRRRCCCSAAAASAAAPASAAPAWLAEARERREQGEAAQQRSIQLDPADPADPADSAAAAAAATRKEKRMNFASPRATACHSQSDSAGLRHASGMGERKSRPNARDSRVLLDLNGGCEKCARFANRSRSLALVLLNARSHSFNPPPAMRFPIRRP